MSKRAFLIAFLASLLATPALAQTGPVATSCKGEIAKFCADKEHNGGVRSCLETHKEGVSKECRHALETTGGGKGRRGMGRGMGNGMGPGMMNNGMGRGMGNGMMPTQ